MGSSTQTPIAGLPQFGDNDKPTWRGDINGAFNTIDAALGDRYTKTEADNLLAAKASIAAMTAALALKVDKSAVSLNGASYGCTPDDGTDQTTNLENALAAANSFLRPVIGGNVFEPGATLYLHPGVYHLTSITTALLIQCNVIMDGVMLVYPDDYAGEAYIVGHTTSGDIVQGGTFRLPHVTKTAPTSFTGTGPVFQNVQWSEIHIGRCTYFATGHWYTGLGAGTVYNNIYPGWVDLCKIGWSITPQAGGWVNQNQWFGHGITQSPNGIDGTGVRRAGYRHLVIDGTNGSGTVNDNHFHGCDFEGDLSEFHMTVKHASHNTWSAGTRFEQGTNATNPTFTTDGHITLANHGLLVDDQVVFLAGGYAPANMKIDPYNRGSIPYYVQSVIDANTFMVAETPGGAATIWNQTGADMLMYKTPRVQFDGSETYHNKIGWPYYAYPGPLDVRNINGAFANVVPPADLAPAIASPTSDTVGTKAAIDAVIAVLKSNGFTL